MKIKICGLNPARDVQLCIDLKVNYLGFVFYKKSPRNVNMSDIKVILELIISALFSATMITPEPAIPLTPTSASGLDPSQ